MVPFRAVSLRRRVTDIRSPETADPLSTTLVAVSTGGSWRIVTLGLNAVFGANLIEYVPLKVASLFVIFAASVLLIIPSRECTTTCVDVAFADALKVELAWFNALTRLRLAFAP